MGSEMCIRDRGDSQKVEDKIFMAADPYCEFTKSIGAEIDRHDRGQGMRSARYTMLIDDNVVSLSLIHI